MESVLDKFLRYVRIDTQAAEGTDSYPSTAKQLDLSRLLASECQQMGLADVQMSEFGIVTATVPATVRHAAPAIAWVAHVDTTPEMSGTNVQPIVHANYSGDDLPLPGDPSQVIRVAENPDLKGLVGGTVVTSDGTTILGADDKAGVAAIMAAAEYLMAHPELEHGPVRLCFTCDEEIGHGVDHIDIRALGCVCAYTLDGDGRGKIDCETFSADLATVTVEGVNTHPSVGKGVMVNALRILSTLVASLPVEELSPENTDGRQGFLHPYQIIGGVERATVKILLRDFEDERLKQYAAMIEQAAEPLRQQYPRAKISVEVTTQYRNMRDGLAKEPRAVSLAEAAMRDVGLEPELSIVRGGTDGSRLTELGLPTPNLSTGEHNPHSRQEWTSLEELQTAAEVLVALARRWGQERAD